MTKKAIHKFLALVLSLVMCICTSVTAFAATPDIESYDTEVVASIQSYEVLMTTTMSNNQKTGYFYVPSCGIFGNTYYFTFTGDSNSFVNFTIYYGNQPYGNGAYLANGVSNSQHLVLPAGEYRIEMNTASSNTILCVVAYNN